MITISVPTDKLVLNVGEKRACISIKDLDAAQFSKMAGKMAEQGGATVTLKGVTMWEGF